MFAEFLSDLLTPDSLPSVNIIHFNAAVGSCVLLLLSETEIEIKAVAYT